jgi:hypothetical protein
MGWERQVELMGNRRVIYTCWWGNPMGKDNLKVPNVDGI